MSLFKPPEILSTPLQDLLLQMRAMGITDIENFPFPTSPSSIGLNKALNQLCYLGAIVRPKTKITTIMDFLDKDNQKMEEITMKSKAKVLFRETGQITDLGRQIAQFPIK